MGVVDANTQVVIRQKDQSQAIQISFGLFLFLIAISRNLIITAYNISIFNMSATNRTPAYNRQAIPRFPPAWN